MPYDLLASTVTTGGRLVSWQFLELLDRVNGLYLGCGKMDPPKFEILAKESQRSSVIGIGAL